MKEKEKEKKSIKANEEEQPSGKSYGALISEKTFVDTDRSNSIQETAASPSLPEDYRNMNVEEEDTP